MTTHRLLTLLTDFGNRDVYVAVMKGVIAQIAPMLPVIDLTHEIPPQNIAAARFNLMTAYPYFPIGTVHVAVVDPGVGSLRRAIALQLQGGYLVGPDNGLFSGVLSQHPLVAAVELTNSDYWRTAAPSPTFHGRDIFAAVGAHLVTGVSLGQLGQAIDPASLIQLSLPAFTRVEERISGCIQAIDRFGNLITNIPGREVEGKSWSVLFEQGFDQESIHPENISGQQTYADHSIGDLIALVGSHGWIEIAVNAGNAQSRLQLSENSPIHVVIHRANDNQD
jgi:S-adenosyl-L-methionine hydrolase (adenosine-forming)